ncbi:EGF-like domain-containing protein 1 [Littorina saxatilis]|uniref:EGF-like domain-containing protein 1 n=1 Tax=Littorina saxatilis TaxID=31220 RepID=UPI0038B5D397
MSCTDTNFCQNDGECRDVGGEKMCFCPQLYTGIKCEVPRIELTCGPTAMTVTVRPHGTFGGAMYAKGKASDPDCVLTASGLIMSKPLIIPGSAEQLTSSSGFVYGTKYTLNVIVQYETTPDIVMGTDQELVATCSFRDSAERAPTGVIFESAATG